MPLGTRSDLEKISVGIDVKFFEGDSHNHVEIKDKEYIIQPRDDKSFFLIGMEGVIGILINRFPEQGYRVIVIERQRIKI